MKTLYVAIAVDPTTTDAAHVNRNTIDDSGEKTAVFLKEFPNLTDAKNAADALNGDKMTEAELSALEVADPAPVKAR